MKIQLEKLKLIEGKDDWLFHSSLNGTVLRKSTSPCRPSPHVERWAAILNARRQRLARDGISYHHLVAPNKECAYHAMLPDGIELCALRLATSLKIATAISPGLLLYPIDELHQASTVRTTYPKGDMHWNWFGAYISYAALARAAGMTPIAANDVEFFDETVRSKFSMVFGRTDLITKSRVVASRTARTFNNRIGAVGNLQRYKNPNTSLPTAMIFRDSFTVQLADYLSQHFSEMTLVWQPNIDWSLIDAERPNHVFGIQSERLMATPPDDDTGPSNSQYVAAKLAALERAQPEAVP